MKKNPLKRLYEWVLHWSETPYGTWALGINSFAEASFFPIPPDVLLIALCVGKPKKSYYYATITTALSVIGGVLGFYIGVSLMDVVGWEIIDFYSARELFNSLFIKFQNYSFWAVLIAAITPIPYKIFTITAGAASTTTAGASDISTLSVFAIFMLASIIGRSVRFFAVATLIFIFGPKVKDLIDKYFNILSIIFVILLILGFILLKYVL